MTTATNVSFSLFHMFLGVLSLTYAGSLRLPPSTSIIVLLLITLVCGVTMYVNATLSPREKEYAGGNNPPKSKIPSTEQYPEVPDNSHPRIAERRRQIEDEKLFEGLFQGAGTVEDLLGPIPFQHLK